MGRSWWESVTDHAEDVDKAFKYLKSLSQTVILMLEGQFSVTQAVIRISGVCQE